MLNFTALLVQDAAEGPAIKYFVFQQDTVIDAGFFDGSLGIICAISALKALNSSGRLGKLRRPVEVRHIKHVSLECQSSFMFSVLLFFVATRSSFFFFNHTSNAFLRSGGTVLYLCLLKTKSVSGTAQSEVQKVIVL